MVSWQRRCTNLAVLPGIQEVKLEGEKASCILESWLYVLLESSVH